MTERPCTWFDDHPEALGEAPPPAHLQTCATCRARVETLERLLRRGLAVREVPVPPALARRIQEAVAARSRTTRRARPPWWALAAPVVAAAAGLGIYLRAAWAPSLEDSDVPVPAAIDAGARADDAERTQTPVDAGSSPTASPAPAPAASRRR